MKAVYICFIYVIHIFIDLLKDFIKRMRIKMQTYPYARNTPGSICQYNEDGLVSRPPSLFTSVRRPMHGTSCPKSQLKSTCLTAKFGSFLDHAETGEKGQNVISSSVQHPISLIFAIHVSFIILLPMMWILLTRPMQKSVTTVCLHCTFARLKNKHIGVLGTNVATIAGYIGHQCLGITYPYHGSHSCSSVEVTSRLHVVSHQTVSVFYLAERQEFSKAFRRG